MAVPKKRVSKMRKNLRHTNWKKEIIPQALIALSKGKSSRLLNSTKIASFREKNSSTDGLSDNDPSDNGPSDKI